MDEARLRYPPPHPPIYADQSEVTLNATVGAELLKLWF